MKDETILFAVQHSRIAVMLMLVALFLLMGATGQVAAHGPCHANPGNVPEFVCQDLPSQQAPRS